MKIEKVLIVDDDVLVCNFLSETLRRMHLETVVVDSGGRAFKALSDHNFDLVITDVRMPDMSGIELLHQIKQASPNVIVVIITAFGSIENSVEAMRSGAFNYLQKPFTADAIQAVIEKAQEHISLLEENKYLRNQVHSGGSKIPFKIIAESPAMKLILAAVSQIAQSNASVFISGESGTGKEVIAHAIHHQSQRAAGPYIKMNCAAVPQTLVESEFFGHEKGAFTGAHAKRLGRFELAHGGSLLLDEVTEIPLSLQAKLLRVVQEHEFERVGGTKSVSVDVRLISTTNCEIQHALVSRMLREDLYYRLNVIPLQIPPLRERREDIIPLAEYFAWRACLDNNKMKKQLTVEARKKLIDYSWPGNIRELSNIIERAVVLDSSPCITAEHLYLDSHTLEHSRPVVGKTLQEAENFLILETLRQCQNNQAQTAEALGISLRVLQSKLSKLEI